MSTAFTPVPVRARRDGWTPARQAAFLTALADTRCIVAACREVGLSYQTAYRLRARADAASFAAAWDAALTGPPLDPSFTSAALHGVAKPITYGGRTVGERRRYDDRLAMFLLAIRSPRYAPARGDERPTAPESADTPALPARQVDLTTGIALADRGRSPGDGWPASSPSAPHRAPHYRAEPTPSAQALP